MRRARSRHRTARITPIALALVATSCASRRAAPRMPIHGEGYCAPPSFTANDVDRPVPAAPPHFAPRLTARYSQPALFIAHAAGVIPLLEAIEATDGPVAPPVPLTTLGGRLLERLHAVHVQVSAVAAELDCEGERADQLRESLEVRETDTNRALTVGSITVGAASAVATAILARVEGAGGVEAATAIVGGVGSASLGLGIYAVHASEPFQHPRNVLADIWRGGPRSDVYPPSVWYYLNEPVFARDGARSVRENLVVRWRRFQHVQPHEGASGTPLLFGDGGAYSVDDLVMRSTLIEQTKAAVSLMDQLIDRLESEAFARIATLGAGPNAARVNPAADDSARSGRRSPSS